MEPVIQYSIFNIQYSKFNIQHSTFNIQHSSQIITNPTYRYALIGFPLSHSFSQKYFTDKFTREGLENYQYELLPIADIRELPALLVRYPDLVGLNVTIPHKEAVIPYLDRLTPEAEVIGAVNTIRIEKDKTLSGFNTDVIGFRTSLLDWLPQDFSGSALILGTGGASKAIAYVLGALGIHFQLVSRYPEGEELSYNELTINHIAKTKLIVNTTPLGMKPKVEGKPEIPYDGLGPNHYIYDLVYNPTETMFLRLGADRGAKTHNGLAMLHGQAEAAWDIWRLLRM